jgi:potassium/hydrogen antiporter
MPSLETVLFGAAILLLTSVLASKISNSVSVPALVIFLLIGMLAGSEGIGGIAFEDSFAAQSFGVVALIFILFSGGLDTPVTEIRHVLARGIVLSTLGVVITALVVGAGVLLLLDFAPKEAFLVGAIVASTDAAAVFSILRTQKISLKGDTIPLLELESGSNDPMAVFLTVGAIELIMQPETSLASLALVFVRQMALGLVFGLALGHLTARVINRLRLQADGLYSVFTIAVALLGFAFTSLLGGSGFLAVYVAGLVMAGRKFIHKRSLSRFHDALAWLMQIIMFLGLGLLVFPSHLVAIASTGILVAVILIFLARPLSVFIGLMFSQFDFRDKLMISWVGLRGATPIVLATFPLIAGVPQSETIFNIVFFVVVISVLVQGSTLIPVARLLGITVPLAQKPQYPFELVTDTDIRNELTEVQIAQGSPAIDRQIVNLGLPEDSLIVLVSRGGEVLVPNGNTIIEQGDTLLVLADKDALAQIREDLQCQPDPAPEPGDART